MTLDINPDFNPNVLGDASEPLPFSDSEFDELHAFHLLEHLERPKIGPAIREWMRVVRPGGLLRISVPNLTFASKLVFDGNIRDYLTALVMIYGDDHQDHMHHHIGFTVEALRQLLEEAGLATQYIDTAPYEVVFHESEEARHSGAIEEIQAIAKKRSE